MPDSTPLLTLATAQANRLETDWDNVRIPVPWFLGRRLLTSNVEELIPLIDWAALIEAPELTNRWSATELEQRAHATLDRLVAEKRLVARAAYGFWPANADGDDILVYKDDARARELVRLHMLRQQEHIVDRGPNLSLADFVAPKASFAPDYIGAFALTAGIGLDEAMREYEQERAGSAVIVRALATRIAEAFAEHMHMQARQDWGYAPAENLSRGDLLHRKYRGIRSVPGSPSYPDRSETAALFRLLHASEIGMSLTEAFDSGPASISGIYLSHTRATDFAVGRIGREQLEDYAARKGASVDQVEQWLAPHL